MSKRVRVTKMAAPGEKDPLRRLQKLRVVYMHSIEAGLSVRQMTLTTIMVFVMVAVASVFFFAADHAIRYVVTLVLGKNDSAPAVRESFPSNHSWVMDALYSWASDVLPRSPMQWAAYVGVPLVISVLSLAAVKLFDVYQRSHELELEIEIEDQSKP